MTEVVYEFTFAGTASDMLAHVFDNCTLTSSGGTTTLRCAVVDQAALHGLIGRIHGLGLELLAIRRVTEGSPCESHSSR